MSGPIVRLRAEHFDEAMAFLNRCFSEQRTMDFATMLPSIYQPTDELMGHNYAILEGQRIVSIVGLFPLKLRIGDVLLRMAGIGGVSAAPERRSQGLMTRLMNHVHEEVRRSGYDLSYLGGGRQRYRNFGWEIAGGELVIGLGKTAAAKASGNGVQWSAVTPGNASMARLKALHDAQHIYCVRSRDSFERFLRVWHHQAFVAERDGVVIGYCVANAEKTRVVEFIAESDRALVEMACAWAAMAKLPTRIVLRALPSSSLFELSESADFVRYEASGNWQIFNWEKLLDALLRLKQRLTPLPMGEVVLGIDGVEGSLLLEVREASAGCAAREHPAAVYLEPMRLTRLLFGPTPPELVAALPPDLALLRAWCPLPLGFSEQDRV